MKSEKLTSKVRRSQVIQPRTGCSCCCGCERSHCSFPAAAHHCVTASTPAKAASSRKLALSAGRSARQPAISCNRRGGCAVDFTVRGLLLCSSVIKGARRRKKMSCFRFAVSGQYASHCAARNFNISTQCQLPINQYTLRCIYFSRTTYSRLTILSG